MDFSAFWQKQIFEIGTQPVLLGRLVIVVLLLIVLYALGYQLRSRWLPRFYTFEDTGEKGQKQINRLILRFLLLAGVLILLIGLYLDVRLSPPHPEDYSFPPFKVSTIVKALLIYHFARLVDEMLSGLLTHRYQQRREQQLKESGIYSALSSASAVKVGRIVQPIVYLLAVLFIIQTFGFDDTLWHSKKDANGDIAHTVTLSLIIGATLILLVTRLGIWVITEIILYPLYQQREINVGSQYAINRLLTYFILMLAILGTLQYLGVNLTVLMGGAAALLVGIGLGLQQTFNDLICGIILLFERTVELGDVVDINGLVGRVKKIGIRTSLVETFDQVSVIVPNSKLVAENVVNWSHFDTKARFTVSVGVAYGSDTVLVKKILLEVAEKNSAVVRRPNPIVRFVDFGNSSLDFQLLFWCRDLPHIEDVKSDLRFAIDARFREENVTIPFPQRDVWFKNAGGDKE
jgi:small-conductance mechanosensitive channel